MPLTPRYVTPQIDAQHPKPENRSAIHPEPCALKPLTHGRPGVPHPKTPKPRKPEPRNPETVNPNNLKRDIGLIKGCGTKENKCEQTH